MAQEEKNANDDSIPKTMKRIRIHEYSDDMSKAVKIDEVDVPQPGENEVLVKVYSVSLNPVDWKIAKGYLSGMFKPELPHPMGYDFAGKIAGIGKIADNNNNVLKIGTRVAGMLDLLCINGSFAEYIVCPIKNISILDDKHSFDIGAALPMVTLTPYQALIGNTDLKEKQGLKVLVLGGSSSTGMAALQIAKYYGASVIATTSSQVDLCTKHGATKVFNYKDANATPWYEELKGGEFDIIFDSVGGKDSWKHAQNVLKRETGDGFGYFISIVNAEAPKLEEADNENKKNVYKWFLINTTTYIDELFKLVSEGKLDVQLDEDSPYTVDTFYDMVQKSIDGKAHGKLIMRFCEEKK